MSSPIIILESLTSDLDAIYTLKIAAAIQKKDPNAHCVFVISQTIMPYFTTIYPPNQVHAVDISNRDDVQEKAQLIKSLQPTCIISLSGYKAFLKPLKKTPIHSLWPQRKTPGFLSSSVQVNTDRSIQYDIKQLMRQALNISYPLIDNTLKLTPHHDRVTVDKNKLCLFIQTEAPSNYSPVTQILELFIQKCLNTDDFFIILAGTTDNTLTHFKHPNCINGIGKFSAQERLNYLLKSDYVLGPVSLELQLANSLNKPSVLTITDPDWNAKRDGFMGHYTQLINWKTQDLTQKEVCQNQLYEALIQVIYNKCLNLKTYPQQCVETQQSFDMTILMLNQRKTPIKLPQKTALFEGAKQIQVRKWTWKTIWHVIKTMISYKSTIVMGKTPILVKALSKMVMVCLKRPPKQPKWVDLSYSELIEETHWMQSMQALENRTTQR